MTDHPITPPPELVQQWWQDTHGAFYEFEAITAQAAQWGADQELEACCQWIKDDAEALRIVRRPKPRSLVKEALTLVEQHEDGWRPSPRDWDTIRRALERLQQLEDQQ